HLLSEGQQPLQGDKQEINPFLGRGSSFRCVPHSVLHYGYSRKGLFPVYRLALDAKPDRVMLWLAENS
ncbi:MAG: hypothetical protein PUF09_01430, partial [Bacteroidales bacterium]|nr:hypothetical protein [Bacteroidales bacterium]